MNMCILCFVALASNAAPPFNVIKLLLKRWRGFRKKKIQKVLKQLKFKCYQSVSQISVRTAYPPNAKYTYFANGTN